MEQMQTAVMVATASHRVAGRLMNAGLRLHDIVNNKLSTCLTLQEVELFRHTADRRHSRLSEVTLPKELINLILLLEQQHEAPAGRLYGYVQKNVYPTFLTVAGYEVAGHLHLTTIQRPELFLIDTITPFIPITQATVTCVGGVEASWTTSVVFVRRAAIALFQVGAQP
jgi:hypothetical protein